MAQPVYYLLVFRDWEGSQPYCCDHEFSLIFFIVIGSNFTSSTTKCWEKDLEKGKISRVIEYLTLIYINQSKTGLIENYELTCANRQWLV